LKSTNGGEEPVGYDRFAEVYSISDLHLSAGAAVDPFALAALGTTIDALTRRASALGSDDAALVLNGDVVDFLSIEPPQYFDANGAPAKLASVFRDTQPFWTALAGFSRVGTVVFTLGNHDVELALPACRAMLRRKVGGSPVLAFGGAGFRCQVGDTTALFVHGNNQDPWNTVDFPRLARIAASLNAGGEPEAWVVNEGTKLVIDELNKQKATHPFVEYVKPEKPWLLELIAKLGFGNLVRQGYALAPRAIRASVRGALRDAGEQSVFLGEEAEPGAAGIGAAVFNADELLTQADRRFRDGARVLGAGTGDETSLGMIRDLFRRDAAPSHEIRKHIIDSLLGETTFHLNQTDDVYKSLGPKLGREVNWAVCGHTHLRRSFEDRSDRSYLNSGTWMRLIDLYDAAASENEFEPVLRALNASAVDELDAITYRDAKSGKQKHLVRREPTVVILKATPAGAEGWLAEGACNGVQPSFAALDGSLRRVTL
jgi:UDP-2,3-diacylglucosamine pyrophosphatase LpxH